VEVFAGTLPLWPEHAEFDAVFIDTPLAEGPCPIERW
jgi:hypothetical protein